MSRADHAIRHVVDRVCLRSFDPESDQHCLKQLCEDSTGTYPDESQPAFIIESTDLAQTLGAVEYTEHGPDIHILSAHRDNNWGTWAVLALFEHKLLNPNWIDRQLKHTPFIHHLMELTECSHASEFSQQLRSHCLCQYENRIQQIHQRLGIAEDYADTHALQLVFPDPQLVPVGLDIFEREQYMQPEAASALGKLIQAATWDGVDMIHVSAFRSVDYQTGIIERKLDKGQTISEIMEVSAAPGYSEHHSGRAVDLHTPECEVLDESFEETTAYNWLLRHASDHGFRQSFPRDNRHGLAYEPWHWYYIGN